MELIWISEKDELITKITNIFNEYVGSQNLAKKLKRFGVTYTKIIKGAFTFYRLRGKDIGVIEIKL